MLTFSDQAEDGVGVVKAGVVTVHAPSSEVPMGLRCHQSPVEVHHVQWISALQCRIQVVPIAPVMRPSV